MTDGEPLRRQRKPTEAELIVAALERRGLDTHANLLEMQRDFEYRGKRPFQSHAYRLLSHALDAQATALGDALWICAHGRAWERGDEFYDERLAGLDRLHALRKEKEE